MRILNVPDPVCVSREEPPVEPVDPGRIDSLEKNSASFLKKLQALDERISGLEKQVAVSPHAPAFDPGVKVQTVSPIPRVRLDVDTESVKKKLLAKMWTYLNDNAA